MRILRLACGLTISYCNRPLLIRRLFACQYGSLWPLVLRLWRSLPANVETLQPEYNRTDGKAGPQNGRSSIKNAVLFSNQSANVISQKYWTNDGPPPEGTTLRRMQMFQLPGLPFSTNIPKYENARRRLIGDIDHLFAMIFSFPCTGYKRKERIVRRILVRSSNRATIALDSFGLAVTGVKSLVQFEHQLSFRSQ